MSDLYRALRSLYDSLGAVLSRMAADDPNSLWVARVMLRIGELLPTVGMDDEPEKAAEAHELAGRVSVVDPSDVVVEHLLHEIEAFLMAF